MKALTGRKIFGRKKCGNLYDDPQEAKPVLKNANLAFSHPFARPDGDVDQDVPRSDDGQGNGRRVREGIRQEIKIAPGDAGFQGPITGGEVLNPATADIRGQTVVYQIGHRSVGAPFGTVTPCADNHVERFKLFKKSGNVGRVVLTVPVHQDKELSLCESDAALYRGAVADVIGMRINHGASGSRLGRRIVRRPVVDDEDLIAGAVGIEDCPDAADDRRDDAPLVECRNDDADL